MSKRGQSNIRSCWDTTYLVGSGTIATLNILSSSRPGDKREERESREINPTLSVALSMYGHHFQQKMGQPSMVANPARGQMNKKNVFSLSLFAPENLVSRDKFGRLVPRQPVHSPHPG